MVVVGGFTVDCFVVGCELLVFSTLAGGSVFVRRSQREKAEGERREVERDGERSGREQREEGEVG